MRILFFRETWNMADKAEMSNDNALAWGWRGEPKSSLEELLRLADADPLALNSPTPEDMRETVRRAKIASHVLVDSKEFVPELTKDESALLDRLNRQHFVLALRRLLLTDPQLPWSEIADFPEERFAKSRISDRVVDMASVFCVDWHVDRVMREVDEFFADGRPFTRSRFEAMVEARRSCPGCRTRRQLPQEH
jgi:hypothetical protein